MPKSPAQPSANLKLIFIGFLTTTLPSLFLALALFVGGIALLALHIPGWSLILGIPATQIGLVFLIFTFDKIARSKVGPDGLHVIHCSICKKPLAVPLGEKEKICEECQQKITKKLKEEKGD